MISLNRVFCCFSSRQNQVEKITLPSKFEKIIKNNIAKIINDDDYICPENLKNRMKKKYNPEPGLLRKIIGKMSKPTAKIIATFTVASVLTPLACAFIISSSIPVLPSLLVLGAEYWANVSVNVITVVVYPVVNLALGAIFYGAGCIAHSLLKKVHHIGVRLNWFNPRNQDYKITLQNLINGIRYDHAENAFYMNGNDEEKLCDMFVETYIKNSLILLKCRLFLKGNGEDIRQYFNLAENEGDNSLSKMFRSGTLTSSLPFPTLNTEAESPQRLANQGLRDMLANKKINAYSENVNAFYIEQKSREEARRILEDLKIPPQAAQSSSSI